MNKGKINKLEKTVADNKPDDFILDVYVGESGNPDDPNRFWVTEDGIKTEIPERKYNSYARRAAKSKDFNINISYVEGGG